MSKSRKNLCDLLILFKTQGGNLFSVFVIAVSLLYRKQKGLMNNKCAFRAGNPERFSNSRREGE